MIISIAYSAMPLVIAALGGLLSERAGVLNISLEGCITAGAFTTVILAGLGIPTWLTLVASVLIGGISGTLLAGFHLVLSTNLFIAGLGINLLIPSLAGLISQVLYGYKGNIPIEVVDLTKFAWLILPWTLIVGCVLYRSRFGRHIRAAGCGGHFLTERGISLHGVQAATLIVSSASAALAGGILSTRIGAYVPGMSSGKGWIALVMIWLGFRRPLGILGAGLVFAIFDIISGQLQGRLESQATLVLAFPYLAALTALIVLSMNGRRRKTRIKKDLSGWA